MQSIPPYAAPSRTLRLYASAASISAARAGAAPASAAAAAGVRSRVRAACGAGTKAQRRPKATSASTTNELIGGVRGMATAGGVADCPSDQSSQAPGAA